MLIITFCHAGESGSPILLVHGFGASAYHWRYNIPELAKRHRVFAVDLLGFGWSTKALVDYQYGEQSHPLQEGSWLPWGLWWAQLLFEGGCCRLLASAPLAAACLRFLALACGCSLATQPGEICKVLSESHMAVWWLQASGQTSWQLSSRRSSASQQL